MPAVAILPRFEVPHLTNAVVNCLERQSRHGRRTASPDVYSMSRASARRCFHMYLLPVGGSAPLSLPSRAPAFRSALGHWQTSN
jgi:hypothetical protein